MAHRGTPFVGVLFCRPGPDVPRHPRHRIQRPLRRPGDPGRAGPAQDPARRRCCWQPPRANWTRRSSCAGPRTPPSPSSSPPKTTRTRPRTGRPHPRAQESGRARGRPRHPRRHQARRRRQGGFRRRPRARRGGAGHRPRGGPGTGVRRRGTGPAGRRPVPHGHRRQGGPRRDQGRCRAAGIAGPSRKRRPEHDRELPAQQRSRSAASTPRPWTCPGWKHVYSGKVRDLYVPVDESITRAGRARTASWWWRATASAPSTTSWPARSRTRAAS